MCWLEPQVEPTRLAEISRAEEANQKDTVYAGVDSWVRNAHNSPRSMRSQLPTPALYGQIPIIRAGKNDLGNAPYVIFEQQF